MLSAKNSGGKILPGKAHSSCKGPGAGPSAPNANPELPPLLITEKEVQERVEPGSKTGVWSGYPAHFQFLAGSFRALVFAHGHIVPSSKTDWVSKEFETLTAKPPSCILHAENPRMWHFRGELQRMAPAGRLVQG